MAVMTVTEWIKKAKEIEQLNTVYCVGAFGHEITPTNIEVLKRNYPSKYPDSKVNALKALVGKKYYAFDCLGLQKSILWGFPNYKYGANNVVDYNEVGMMNLCSSRSTDFSQIVDGAVLYMSGHVGIYVGDGKVIESSPKWKNGVQITNLGNISKYKTGNYRIWEQWGKLNYIDYKVKVEVNRVKYELDIISKGCKDGINGVRNVKAMQGLLTAKGYPLSIDGSCGSKSVAAIKEFQTHNEYYKKIGGIVDGICGKNTWCALLQ